MAPPPTTGATGGAGGQGGSHWASQPGSQATMGRPVLPWPGCRRPPEAMQKQTVAGAGLPLEQNRPQPIAHPNAHPNEHPNAHPRPIRPRTGVRQCTPFFFSFPYVETNKRNLKTRVCIGAHPCGAGSDGGVHWGVHWGVRRAGRRLGELRPQAGQKAVDLLGHHMFPLGDAKIS